MSQFNCDQCCFYSRVLHFLAHQYFNPDIVSIITDFLEWNYIIDSPVTWDEKTVERQSDAFTHYHELQIDTHVPPKFVFAKWPYAARDYNPMYFLEGYYAHRTEYWSIHMKNSEFHAVPVACVQPDVYVQFILDDPKFSVNIIKVDRDGDWYFISSGAVTSFHVLE